jgi:mannose-1-phosphate guanylyltransferase
MPMIVAVILSGGSGARLWPLSTPVPDRHPEQWRDSMLPVLFLENQKR